MNRCGVMVIRRNAPLGLPPYEYRFPVACLIGVSATIYDPDHMTRSMYMQEHVSKSQFKARALELFREVESTGNPVIVTDHGKPAIEIRKYRDRQRDPLAILKNSVTEYAEPTEPVADDDWEALG